MFEKELNELLNDDKVAYSLLKFLNNEKFEEELINFSKKGFEEIRDFEHPLKDDKKLVLFCLTFIALKYYDGNLWEHVYKKFHNLFNDENEMTKCIINKVLNSLSQEYNCKRKYYQIPVINSIIPFNYAKDYFEFAYDIYTKNLECNISDCNVEQEVEDIFNVIKEQLNDNDDSFKYDYEQNSKKTYKLIQATKSIIKSGFKLDELLWFTKDIINKIDCFYNAVNLNTNYYIDESFNKWYQTKHNDLENINDLKKKSNNLKSGAAYFTYSNNIVYLHTPTRKERGIYDPKLFSLQIYENEKLIYENKNLIVKQIIGASVIEEYKYEIKNPLNKISCKLLYDNQILYDSKESLFRNFLIFNDNQNELKNNRSYQGLVYFLYKLDCDNKLSPLYENEFYKTAYANVYEDNQFILDNEKIFFTDYTKSQINGDKITGLELIKENDNISIYKDIKKIIFVSNNLNEAANKIKINSNFINIEDVDVIKQDNEIIYIIDFKKLNFLPGLYKIEFIDIENDKTIKKYQFLYDPKIDINQIILNNDEIIFQYNGTFLIINENNENIAKFNLLINDLNKTNYYLDIDNVFYNCKFNLTIPYYQIDNKTINIFNKPITSEDFMINSKLFFNIIDCNKVNYSINENNNKELKIKTLDHKQYVELGELINFKDCDVIKIQFFSNNNETNCLFLYNNPIFDINQFCLTINSIKEEIEFKTFILGKKSTDLFFIKLENKNEIIQSQELNNINTFKISNKIQTINYCIYQEIKKLIGFKTSQTINILEEGNFNYYPISALLKKYLLINKILLEEYKDRAMLEVKNQYLKLVNRVNESEFIGYLYTYENGKMQYLDKIKQVKVDITNNVYDQNNNFYFDAKIYINNGKVCLLQFDKNKRNVFNGNSMDYRHISKYRINLTLGQQNYEKFKSNRKS